MVSQSDCLKDKGYRNLIGTVDDLDPPDPPDREWPR
jgi:hypothetical protein